MTAKKTSTKKAPAKKAVAKKAPAKKAPAKKAPAKRAPAKPASSREGATSARMKQILEKHDALYGEGYFTPTDVVCPLCGAGVIVPKRGRFGAEWRCNADARPMCSFKVETKPTGATCAYVRDGRPCGALMVAGTKTIPDRCSDKSCPNRNPHKL